MNQTAVTQCSALKTIPESLALQFRRETGKQEEATSGAHRLV